MLTNNPLLAQDLGSLEPLLVEYLLTPNEPTNQILRHIFASGGKRIRPALFLTTCKAIGYDGPHLFPIASVCEYIHTASLLHDDVIDNSTLRRGRPTANSIWGDESAVLAGDLIYSAACRLMVKTASLPLIDTFAECIRSMSESELFQLDLLFKLETSELDYNRVVSGKTAKLFEASCLTPCFLKETSAEVADAFATYGRCLGFAFQIADDCLDYDGAQEDVGKNLVADLMEGKVTLPLIFALNTAKAAKTNAKQGGFAQQFLSTVENILSCGEATPNQKSLLVEGVQVFDGLTLARASALQQASQGENCLKTIRDQLPHANQNALQMLSDVLRFVVERRQ
jgi:octaprenyl-diphosphate synthase